jgi:hypothetical protein
MPREAFDLVGNKDPRRDGIVPARQVEEERALDKDDSLNPSRRRVLAGGAAVLAGAVAARRARADEKLAQDIVQYRATPGDDGSKCIACVNFEAPNGCKIVAGNINPNGWCVAFAPKG